MRTQDVNPFTVGGIRLKCTDWQLKPLRPSHTVLRVRQSILWFNLFIKIFQQRDLTWAGFNKSSCECQSVYVTVKASLTLRDFFCYQLLETRQMIINSSISISVFEWNGYLLSKCPFSDKKGLKLFHWQIFFLTFCMKNGHMKQNGLHVTSTHLH